VPFDAQKVTQYAGHVKFNAAKAVIRPLFLKCSFETLTGAGEEIRTLDIHLGKVALYH